MNETTAENRTFRLDARSSVRASTHPLARSPTRSPAMNASPLASSPRPPFHRPPLISFLAQPLHVERRAPSAEYVTGKPSSPQKCNPALQRTSCDEVLRKVALSFHFALDVRTAGNVQVARVRRWSGARPSGGPDNGHTRWETD